MGVMKYIRGTLMGYEIFFEIFDGSQNIFSSSIFVILFFKVKGVGAQIIQTLSSRGFKKDMLK